MIRAVTTVGTQPILLKHWIKHYKSLGVDDLCPVIWGQSDKVLYDEIMAVLENENVKPFKNLIDVGNTDSYYLTQIYNDTLKENPNDWWIVADLDEFLVLPKNIKDVVLELEEQKLNYAYSLMLDRIGENGEFSELNYDDDIWKTYPNVGFVNRYIRNNDCRKMSLLKYSEKGLSLGHHSLVQHNAYKPWDVWVERMKSDSSMSMKHQTHNFTWKKYDIEKFLMYSKYWNFEENIWAGREYDNMIDYFNKNKRLDLKDERFFIDYCPDNNFSDYKFWNQVKQIKSYST